MWQKTLGFVRKHAMVISVTLAVALIAGQVLAVDPTPPVGFEPATLVTTVVDNIRAYVLAGLATCIAFAGVSILVRAIMRRAKGIRA